MTTETTFEEWALLEIMGHQRYAGRVSEQTVGGASFVRIDVPECDGEAAFTKLFGAGSIYCITPVSEQIARAIAKQSRKRPIDVYDLPSDMRPGIEQKPKCAICGKTSPCECDDDYYEEDLH